MAPDVATEPDTSSVSVGSIRVPSALVDSALAVVVAVTASLEALRSDDQRMLVLAVGAVTAGAVALRRRAPSTTAIVVIAALLVIVIAERDPGALVIGPMIAIYTVGERVSVRTALGIGLASLVVAGVIAFFDDAAADVAIGAALVISPLAVGQAVASRRAYIDELQSRLVASSSARQAEIDQALVEERLRIARDLHDVIAHTVAVVNVQSSVALKHASHIEPAADALSAIRTSSAHALDELRVMLRVLRADDGDDVAPASSGSVVDVIEHAEAAGLDVRADLDRDAVDRLPPAVLAVARRVVQESITNVVRHSDARRVEIGLVPDRDLLTVTVADPGPRRTGTTVTGVGLSGLRDRVVLHGGTFDAGPQGNGFVVRASIPVAAAGSVAAAGADARAEEAP